MRYILIIAVLALVCCTAQIAAAAPSIVGVSTDVPAFNSHTGSVDIGYELVDVDNGSVVISIYGESGKAVDLFPGPQGNGSHSFTWDGGNSNGVGTPDGYYTILVRVDKLGERRQPQPVKVFGNQYAGEELIPALDNLTAVNSSGYAFTINATAGTIGVSSPAGNYLGDFLIRGEEQPGNVSSIAVDRLDNIYLADPEKGRALVLDRAGNLILILDYAAVEIGESYRPAGIGVDPEGYIYTADRDNDCVEVFAPIIASSTGVLVDSRPPSVEAALKGTLNGDWYTSSVNIALFAREGGSGVKEIDYLLNGNPVKRISGENAVFVITNGVYTLDYWSTDNVGNEGKPESLAVRVDTMPPMTSVVLTGSSGNNGWYRSTVNGNLSASDYNGSGVFRTQYSLDGAHWIDGTSFDVEAEGINPVYFRSIDAAGNVESARSVEVRIDTTAPRIRHDFRGPSPQGWFTSDVTATLFPADDVSGIGATEYSLDGVNWYPYTSAFTIPASNLFMVYYRTADQAGNTAVSRSFIHFWPTSLPDFSDFVNQSSSRGPAGSGTISASGPGYTPTTPYKTSVTPGPVAGVPTPGSASQSSDLGDTLIRIWIIVASFADFFP